MFFAVVAGNRSMRELKVSLYHYIDGLGQRIYTLRSALSVINISAAL